MGLIGGSHPVAAIARSTSRHSPPSTGTPAVTYRSDGAQGGGVLGGGATPSSPLPGSPPPGSPPPVSPPSVMPDQVNDPAWTGGAENMAPANRDSQEFVPSLPHLVAVEVALITINAGRGGDTVTLTILDGNGQEVAMTSADIAEGFDGFYRFVLPDGGPPVTPGQPLTIMLQDSGTLVFGWKYVAGSPYPRGQAYFDGSTFGTNDFLFRTYGSQQ
jgi:hypothetical protein